jgi:UDP-N-acetylglucosamine 4,6-dehydratase
VELEDMFVVQPSGMLWFGHGWQEQGHSLPDGFRYASDTNPHRLSLEQIREIIAPFEMERLRETEG